MSIRVEIGETEARRLRDEWEDRAIHFEEEAASLRRSIKAIEAQLDAKLPITQPQPMISGPGKNGKRKKGENLRIITAFLSNVASKGATLSDIHKGTGVGVSSVNVVLNRHSDVFHKGEDGLWRRK